MVAARPSPGEKLTRVLDVVEDRVLRPPSPSRGDPNRLDSGAPLERERNGEPDPALERVTGMKKLN